MAGTFSHSYKKYQRNERKLATESTFAQGMQFTDNPLPQGTSRLLVNMIQKDFGERLRPRGGWRNTIEPVALGNNLGETYIHHSGYTFVKDKNSTDTFLRRYALVLTNATTHGSLTNSKVIIELPLENGNEGLAVSQLKSGATIYKIKHNKHETLVEMHGMKAEGVSPTGIQASIEGNTYLLTDQGLGRLHVYYDNGNYTHEVQLVTPLEVTPLQAVNYGYNMLLDTPFNFPNKSAITFRPLGILPYDVSTNLIKMQAKVGEPVRFKLIHEYQTDVNYKVQWEAQDITKQGAVEVIQKKEDSPTYKNGQDIYVDYTSPLKQFSIIATVYKADDLENPVRVMVLASYHLADDSNIVRSEQRNFDLTTATGLTVWKNQMVYYGVQGAELSIFISDVNDPTYVPFPNSTVIFNERVLKAFPYLDSLIVVTENTLFQVDFALEDGFTSKPVQANMQLRDYDTASMYGVRNMVCFKSNNYYFMVVPNIKNDKGELQIAPISNPVSMLLDNFGESIRKILSEVYTLSHLFNAPAEEIFLSLHDYKSYSEGNRLRHVYKLKLEVRDVIVYVDTHLIYDTIHRSWTVEILESTRRPLHVFQTLSTGYAQFLGLYDKNGTTYVQWVKIDEHEPEDYFRLDGDKDRIIPNFQMVDTGKRDLEGTTKKRIRHIILELNNLSNLDIEFNHLVYMDDTPRTDLFKYNVVHETDSSAPNYGQIYVEREYMEPTTIHGTTLLGTWSLGNSQFPEQTVLKAHLEVSGKGYYPRLRLITRTSRLYELNQISWAYRDMNSR